MKKERKCSQKQQEQILKANTGDLEAQYFLANQYTKINNENNDFIPEISFYYTNKLSQNDNNMKFQLGKMYFYGIGTDKNIYKAYEIFTELQKINKNFNNIDEYIEKCMFIIQSR